MAGLGPGLVKNLLVAVVSSCLYSIGLNRTNSPGFIIADIPAESICKSFSLIRSASAGATPSVSARIAGTTLILASCLMLTTDELVLSVLGDIEELMICLEGGRILRGEK